MLQPITFTYAAGLPEAIYAKGWNLARVDGQWMADPAADVQAYAAAWAGSADELAYLKAQKLAALETQYDAIIAAGRLYSVEGGTDASQHLYQIDDVPPFVNGLPTRRASQDTITSMGSQAKAVLDGTPGTAVWQSNFAWMDANNVGVPMTAAQCYAFTQNVAAYVEAVDAVYFALRAQINGAADAATVGAIDLTSGWPSNP